MAPVSLLRTGGSRGGAINYPKARKRRHLPQGKRVWKSLRVQTVPKNDSTLLAAIFSLCFLDPTRYQVFGI